MNLLDKIFVTRSPDDTRERKAAHTEHIVDDFLRELRDNIHELQEASRPERKDYPIAGALRRGPQK